MNKYPLADQFKTAELLSIRKGEVLLRAGESTNKIYYVEKGCLRGYIIDNKEKEHIYQFAPEDWMISDEEALLMKTPAILYIDAIEDSIIRVITAPFETWGPDLRSEAAIPAINRLLRKVNAFRKRILLLLSATADERYAHFLETYPNLSNRVPLKMIASYLGITAESLSRIRKERASKNKPS